MTEKACRSCRYIVSGDACPLCQGTDLTKDWEGYILMVKPEESKIASEIGATTPGKYALKLK
jgi:DNA-directed RNA polymerase subunit E"